MGIRHKAPTEFPIPPKEPQRQTYEFEQRHFMEKLAPFAGNNLKDIFRKQFRNYMLNSLSIHIYDPGDLDGVRPSWIVKSNFI